jgi:DNA-binding PadR family transcriptional regulator
VARKYYRITETGIESLQEMIESWNDFKTIIDGMHLQAYLPQSESMIKSQ